VLLGAFILLGTLGSKDRGENKDNSRGDEEVKVESGPKLPGDVSIEEHKGSSEVVHLRHHHPPSNEVVDEITDSRLGNEGAAVLISGVEHRAENLGETGSTHVNEDGRPEEHVVSRVEAVPEGRSELGDDVVEGSVLPGETVVHVVLEPVVDTHVPVVSEHGKTGGHLAVSGVGVRDAVPAGLSVLESVESKGRGNARGLGKLPSKVVLEAGEGDRHKSVRVTVKERGVGEESFSLERLEAESKDSSDDNKRVEAKGLDDALDGGHEGRGSLLQLVLFPENTVGELKILTELVARTSEDSSEEEDVRKELNDIGELGDGAVLTEVVDVLLLVVELLALVHGLTVFPVVGKGTELNSDHHLLGGEVKVPSEPVGVHAVNVRSRHVNHGKDEDGKSELLVRENHGHKVDDGRGDEWVVHSRKISDKPTVEDTPENGENVLHCSRRKTLVDETKGNRGQKAQDETDLISRDSSGAGDVSQGLSQRKRQVSHIRVLLINRRHGGEKGRQRQLFTVPSNCNVHDPSKRVRKSGFFCSGCVPFFVCLLVCMSEVLPLSRLDSSPIAMSTLVQRPSLPKLSHVALGGQRVLGGARPQRALLSPACVVAQVGKCRVIIIIRDAERNLTVASPHSSFSGMQQLKRYIVNCNGKNNDISCRVVLGFSISFEQIRSSTAVCTYVCAASSTFLSPTLGQFSCLSQHPRGSQLIAGPPDVHLREIFGGSRVVHIGSKLSFLFFLFCWFKLFSGPCGAALVSFVSSFPPTLAAFALCLSGVLVLKAVPSVSGFFLLLLIV